MTPGMGQNRLYGYKQLFAAADDDEVVAALDGDEDVATATVEFVVLARAISPCAFWGADRWGLAERQDARHTLSRNRGR